MNYTNDIGRGDRLYSNPMDGMSKEELDALKEESDSKGANFVGTDLREAPPNPNPTSPPTTSNVSYTSNASGDSRGITAKVSEAPPSHWVPGALIQNMFSGIASLVSNPSSQRDESPTRATAGASNSQSPDHELKEAIKSALANPNLPLDDPDLVKASKLLQFIQKNQSSDNVPMNNVVLENKRSLQLMLGRINFNRAVTSVDDLLNNDSLSTLAITAHAATQEAAKAAKAAKAAEQPPATSTASRNRAAKIVSASQSPAPDDPLKEAIKSALAKENIFMNDSDLDQHKVSDHVRFIQKNQNKEDFNTVKLVSRSRNWLEMMFDAKVVQGLIDDKSIQAITDSIK